MIMLSCVEFDEKSSFEKFLLRIDILEFSQKKLILGRQPPTGRNLHGILGEFQYAD